MNAPADRMARSRKARADKGFRQIAVMLTPASVAKLVAWRIRGLSATQAVNLLLERSKP